MRRSGIWRRVWWRSAAALLIAAPAFANDCSGTVGTSAASVSFPSSGNTGPSRPTQYVTISNPAGAGSTPRLAVNPDSTAVDGGAGSFVLYPGGSITWTVPDYPVPASISIIASAGSTPYTCKYQ